MSFYYLSPLVVPTFAGEGKQTEFAMQTANVLSEVAPGVADLDMKVRIETFSEGKRISEDVVDIAVRDGIPDVPGIVRSFSTPDPGYALVSITADRPCFRRLHTEHVYSFVRRSDGGWLILNASQKFADPLIIDVMRRVGKFCLVHPAHLVDAARDIGNSTLIVNPFDGPIVATLQRGDGKRMRRRILPQRSELVRLDGFVRDGEPTCVVYTGSNRYPAWDVRHSLSDPTRINRIDHLEFYRGNPTVRRLGMRRYAVAKVKRLLRDLGLSA
jgi:hypothetical protein